MKTLAIAMLFFTTAIPFVEEPQYLKAPKPSIVNLGRK